MALLPKCDLLFSCTITLILLKFAAANSNAGFCAISAASSTCPNPPTVATLDLDAYLGRWYEIGSTASFKLLSESGLACNQALYQRDPKTSAITLLNSGQTVISTLARAEVSAINLAAKAACAAASDICTQTDAAAATARTLPAGDAASLAAAAGSARRALDRISLDITRVQQLNDQISEAKAALAPSVSDLQSAASDAKSTTDISVVGFARRLSELHVDHVALKVVSSIAAIDLALQTIHLSSKTLLSNGQPITSDHVSSVQGTITQPDASSPAKLAVNINGVKAPYWIIDLVEDSRYGSHGGVGYSAALVYSCSQVSKVVLAKSLFILSRTPYLDPSITTRFLAKAVSFGIYNDCDDPFLFTLQKGGQCGRAS